MKKRMLKLLSAFTALLTLCVNLGAYGGGSIKKNGIYDEVTNILAAAKNSATMRFMKY